MNEAKVTVGEFIKVLQERDPTEGIKVIVNGIIEEDVYLSIGTVADDNKNVYIGVHDYIFDPVKNGQPYLPDMDTVNSILASTTSAG